MAGFDREQRRVARKALRTADRLGASPREAKALILAGIVESTLRHQRYSRPGSGDRDSVGFLQQRPSMGWGPPGESVQRDAAQFLRAARRVNRSGFKGSAGKLAQAVQRSAFPDRYDEVSPQYGALVRQLGVQRGRGGRGGGGSPLERAARALGMPQGSEGMLPLLAAMAQGQPQGGGQSAGVAPPVFSATPAMPQGAQVPVSGGGPAPRQDVGALMEAVRTLGGDIPGLGDGRGPGGGRDGGSEAASGPSGGRGGNGAIFRPRGGYKGSQGPARALAQIGLDLGLRVTSAKRDNTNPYSGSRSDHDHGNKDAFAYDISNGSRPTREMDRAAFRIARQLGIKGYTMGHPINTTVQRNGIRVQVIYRGDGPSYGGNHMNHIHIGVKNVRGSGGRDRGVVRR